MTTAHTTRSGLIDAGATTLYHEVRGSGPALLFITGGTGDAGGWAHVAPPLAEAFTVVTYDRRGFSRSPRPEGSTGRVEEHADDAAALLRALDLAPAAVVGHSSGASIACSLVARHPAVVRHAVIYEPPLLAAVPGGEGITAGMRAMVEQALADGGPRHAMEMFMRQMGGEAAFASWIASTDAAVVERIFTNSAMFFQVEMPAFATFVPDRERMRASGVPLTVVVGEESRDSWFGAAAAWLVDGTGAGRVEFPGGHAGFDTHQQEFVELVRRLAR